MSVATFRYGSGVSFSGKSIKTKNKKTKVMAMLKYDMSVMLLEMTEKLKQIDTSDLDQFGDGAQLKNLAYTVNGILSKLKQPQISVGHMAAPPPRTPVIKILNGYEDKTIKYNSKEQIVGSQVYKQPYSGNNVIGCNEFLCNGQCKRVTFVCGPTLNDLLSGDNYARKKYGNALLKTRRFCPVWRKSHNQSNPDKKVTQPTALELKSMRNDFNHELAQEKLRRSQWSCTFTEDAPIGLRLKFDYDAGLLTGVSVNNSEGLPVLLQGGQMIELVEEEVLCGAKLLKVNEKHVVGETKETIMSLLKNKRPLTLAFTISHDKVPSDILKVCGLPAGGIESKIWADLAGNKQLAMLTVAAATADDEEVVKKQRIG